MSSGRIVIAGLVGGGAMFMWGMIAHVVLPLGRMGVENVPQETMVMSALKFSIQDRGLYRFPGMAKDGDSDAADKEWQDKYRAGPRGVIVFDPTGETAMSAKLLGAELGSNILAALFLSIVLARTHGGPMAKAMFGAALGLFAWATIDLSYWNWFRFPATFIIAEGIDQCLNGLVSGLAIALTFGRGLRSKVQTV